MGNNNIGNTQRLRVDGKFFARGTERFRVQGVTYGPFAPHSDNEMFPQPSQVKYDFELMRLAEINSVRTYHLPPVWFLDLACEQGLGIFVDVPWAKHLCFLDSAQAQRDARQAVSEAAKRGQNHPALLAYSIGNEIPPSVIRWHGGRCVERFLAELRDVVKQQDPEGLVTYANYPSTEYLDLSFLDFATFNVYLHHSEAFRRYLFRLQNLVGDQPLLLGELGMDTLRNGEEEQARFLSGHLNQLVLMGLAGAFVFSWTDEWYTGGHSIKDWAFGITDDNRRPKAAYHELGKIFTTSPANLLQATPRVSIVVCSYNGGRTLDQCVRSLLEINYPNYEIIVVDDGSTDNTREILSRFPSITVIHQENLGLSVARNAGMKVASGGIIAYTDSDCFADPDWLSHLVYQFSSSDAAAVGGPNLSPEDGWLASCVGAAPGQPTHVLVSDQEAEHIPGCNMAFRREALEVLKGFDPTFRKAGDDVDVCWRLQQAGYWITFAPGAFVWHHRRQNPRAFFRQQAGYGEAEALLRFKHPDRFNSRGDGKWNGVIYGPSIKGLRLSNSIIYRGVFGTGMFQCLYNPGPAHWAALPGTLEWHVASLVLALAAIAWPFVLIGVGGMILLSVAVAITKAIQARLAPRHDGWKSRILVAWLCYVQPLVRSWHRYRTRVFDYRSPRAHPTLFEWRGCTSLSGKHTTVYWNSGGIDRLQLLSSVVHYLNDNRWTKTLDSGWRDWDLEIYCHPWTVVQVRTVDEHHGDNKVLIRIGYRLRPSSYWNMLAGMGIILGASAIPFSLWTVAAAAATCLASCAGLWWLGTCRAAHAISVFDLWANKFGLIRCQSGAVEQVKTSRSANWLRRLFALSAGVRRPKKQDRSLPETPAIEVQDARQSAHFAPQGVDGLLPLLRTPALPAVLQSIRSVEESS